ncbi:MAG: hypothetical protein ACRC2B_16015 [Rubrivivax sp.]
MHLRPQIPFVLFAQPQARSQRLVVASDLTHIAGLEGVHQVMVGRQVLTMAAMPTRLRVDLWAGIDANPGGMHKHDEQM